jgi:hypothetical protein
LNFKHHRKFNIDLMGSFLWMIYQQNIMAIIFLIPKYVQISFLWGQFKTKICIKNSHVTDQSLESCFQEHRKVNFNTLQSLFIQREICLEVGKHNFQCILQVPFAKWLYNKRFWKWTETPQPALYYHLPSL